ncbi:hypothetical protein CAPTEDRAFT_76477, partial [Capitella teleta]
CNAYCECDGLVQFCEMSFSLDASVDFHSATTMLYLAHNKIKELEPMILKRLIVLDVSYNQLKQLWGGFCEGRLPTLAWLFLSHNLLQSVPPRTFRGCIQLTRLDLSYNYIDSLNDESLVSLHNLEILNISYCQLSVIDSNAFLPVSKIKILILSNNRLTSL